MISDQNPFLAQDFHVRWSTLRPEAVVPDLRFALKRAASAIRAITRLRGLPAEELTYESTLGAYSAATRELGTAWGKVGHLNSVCDSPELRAAYREMQPEVNAFFAGLPLNPDLWAALATFGTSVDASRLRPALHRHVSETLEDFREAGAELPEAEKAQVAALLNELADLTRSYSENVLDATNGWEKLVTDEAELAGLPDSARAAALQDAREKDHGSEDQPVWRFTLHGPSLVAVLTYADSDDLRRSVWTAHNQICAEGAHSNRELVVQILEKRDTLATLLGRDSFAELTTARRMVGSGAAADAFVESIRARVAPAFERESEALSAFKAKVRGTAANAPMEPWELSYWAEKQRAALYDFDEEALRPYFPIHRVIGGMFDLAERLFGFRIRELPTHCLDSAETAAAPSGDPAAIEVWHPDVKAYAMSDEDGHALGTFYADWYPRESKRGGAWMNSLITGEPDPASGRLGPHLGLICGNMSKPVGGKPALLTHREVETVFHEFGHLIHHLCGEVEVPELNGTNVPWDFVELPSQIMENWCWERESLDLFARHFETEAPIPEDLFQKMAEARNYRAASFTMRQLAFAKLDLALHREWVKQRNEPAVDFVSTLLEDYTPPLATRPLPYIFQFSHLFSSTYGYACGYYSYKYAEVLDADAFTRFQKEGILNPETGRAFRRAILATGNSRPPEESFAEFIGRAPDPDALLRRCGLL